MDEGFLAPRRTSPATLGIVVAAHVAVLAVVILAKGPVSVPHFPITRLVDIAPDKVPDPLPPPPDRAVPQPGTASRLDKPQPPVPTEPTDATVVLPPLPPVPPLPAAGSSGATIDPPPAHVAVLADAVLDPRFAHDLQPPYPPSMMRAEVEGRAVVRVLVGVDGRVKAVEIVSADDPAFAEATRRQALGHWRFRPATRDGVPVEAWRTMTVRFRLDA